LQAILKQVQVFVKEFAAGGPAAMGSGESSAPPKQPVKQPAKAFAETSQPQKKEKAAAKSSSGSRSKFESTEKFYARAKDIYNCFTDSKCISAYTQSPSTVFTPPPPLSRAEHMYRSSKIVSSTEWWKIEQ